MSVRQLVVIVSLAAASSSLAVEANYNFGVELKPLPILMTSMTGGQGLGVGFELNSSIYHNWVVVSSAEVYKGPRNDEGMVPDNMEKGQIAVEETEFEYQQLSFGLRSYSNRQDDTYYVGGELSVANEVQEFEVSDSIYNVQSQSLRPAVEFGYRWIWDNGSMFRLGMKGVFITNTQNRLDGDGAELPEVWREEFYKVLDEAERKTSFYATMDVGIGYTF